MEIMNLKMFLDEMDNDYETVEMIVSQYITSLEEQLKNMKKLLDESSYSVLSREAHSIKGGARNLMAPRLEKVSMELETLIAGQDRGKITKGIENLESEFLIYKDYVKDNLSNINLGC